MTAVRFIVAVLCSLLLFATSIADAQLDSTIAPAVRPNILFLMADDWSSPYAGVLGDPVVQTPAFDRVAREGVLFQNAFVSAPSCTPSRLAVATGQWHWRLQDGANLGGSLRAGVPVYPELLQAAGYQIGFARKGAEPSDHKYTHRDPFGPRFKTFAEFIAQRKAGAPFCFWYGAGEPHRPYRFGEGEAAGLDPANVKLPGCLPDNETTRRDFADYLHRIQRYDSDCARMLALLETSGELDNTIVVMSGDNGLPFPRCKATLYDTGTHVPLAIRWGETIKGGRTIADFVSLTDLAPTFLEAAGLQPPSEMTGRSLMPILRSGRSGQVDQARTSVLSGMERHVVSQPARAIRTAEFLYIHNFELKSWPKIETTEPLPRIDYAKGEWVADGKGFPLNLEQSPTLQFLLDHRDQPGVKPFYARATAARPEEELYDLEADPSQLHNVASEPAYARNRAALRKRLTAALRAAGDPRATVAAPAFDTRKLVGWTVQINRDLLAQDTAATARALALLQTQLEEISRVVPAAALTQLQTVPLWISPEYPDTPPRAEYHPDARWLRRHGRDPAMAKGVEFTNIRIFAAETRRMPNFTLHELAHAYHHRVLADGFANEDIKAAYEKAKASGRYDRVERQDSEGRKRMDRAYAMTNPQEYFAETTEAFFSRNDFFPYTGDELKQHDPEMFALLTKLWGVEAKPGESKRKTAAAFKQAPVDFNHPPRDYVTHRIQGWDVLVEKQLVHRAPELAQTALARLEQKLGETVAVLPAAALPDLRQVNLFVMYGPDATAGGRQEGLEYFRADAAQDQDWLDPRMARSIVIWSAPNYAKLSEFWALKALVHEFGHAQHLEHWPEDRADIYDTWGRAIKAGLYQVVREEDKGTHVPNYAAQNHLEYFAELTAMYFVGANYFPRDRAGLKAYDPAGYALLETLWGLNQLDAGQRRKGNERGLAMNGPLYLSAADLRRALPMRAAIDAMRDAFGQLSRGDVTMPTRLRLDARAEHGAALIMPCHSSAEQMFSLKMVTVFDDNPQRGLPLIQATVLLTDGATGTPLAVVDGASLTAIRTGAASGLATDLLARADAATAAVIGTGVQARTQLEAVCCVRPIRLAWVYGRNAEAAERFAAEMSQQLGLTVKRAGSPSAAIRDADIVCTATGSTTPLFEDRDLPTGTHINAIGSYRPDMIEIPSATVRRARVVVDHHASALEEAGDLLAPYRNGLIAESHFRTELGDIVLGRSAGRSSAADITLFKSVGVAIQDLCATARALENARRLGIGTILMDSARP